MSETYSVLARDEITTPIPPIARAIAKATGQIAFDVTRQLRNSVGVLASGLSQDDADKLVGSLSQVNVNAFALAESGIVRFPEPVFLETTRLGPDALEVADLRGENNKPLGKIKVAYGDIVFMATAHVRTETTKRVVESRPNLQSMPPMVGGGLAAAIPAPDAGQRIVRHVTHSDYDHFLDIFAIEPAHHLRLNASTFNFVQTGLDMQPSSIANLTFFITHFVPLCDQAHIDPSIRHILDGSPHTNLKCSSPAQYDGYLSWRIQLLYHPKG